MSGFGLLHSRAERPTALHLLHSRNGREPDFCRCPGVLHSAQYSLNRVATQYDLPFRDPNALNSTVFGPVFTADPGQVVQIWLKAQFVVDCNATATAPYWSTLFDVARIEFELKVVEQMSDGTWLVNFLKRDDEAVHSALFFYNRRIITWSFKLW